MTRYQMPDGTEVDTDDAVAYWDDGAAHNSHQPRGAATESAWDHQGLYKTRDNRYWLECTCRGEGRPPYADWLDVQAAARRLLAHGKELPEDLVRFAGGSQE